MAEQLLSLRHDQGGEIILSSSALNFKFLRLRRVGYGSDYLCDSAPEQTSSFTMSWHVKNEDISGDTESDESPFFCDFDMELPSTFRSHKVPPEFR